MKDEPSTEPFHISLSESQADYIQERVDELGCASPSEFIAGLVRADQERHAQGKLNELLLEGLNAGPDVEMTTQDWADIRSEVQAELGRQKTVRPTKLSAALATGLNQADRGELLNGPEVIEQARARFRTLRKN